MVVVTRTVQIAILSGIIFCLFSVALGAFAAHGLKSVLNEYQLGIFETAAKYQMYHGLALIMVGLFGMFSASKLQFVNFGFVAGVLCFSGSLYLLAILELRWLAFITPVGGILLLLGWSAFLIQALLFFKSSKTENAL